MTLRLASLALALWTASAAAQSPFERIVALNDQIKAVMNAAPRRLEDPEAVARQVAAAEAVIAEVASALDGGLRQAGGRNGALLARNLKRLRDEVDGFRLAEAALRAEKALKEAATPTPELARALVDAALRFQAKPGSERLGRVAKRIWRQAVAKRDGFYRAAREESRERYAAMDALRRELEPKVQPNIVAIAPLLSVRAGGGVIITDFAAFGAALKRLPELLPLCEKAGAAKWSVAGRPVDEVCAVAREAATLAPKALEELARHEVGKLARSLGEETKKLGSSEPWIGLTQENAPWLFAPEKARDELRGRIAQMFEPASLPPPSGLVEEVDAALKAFWTSAESAAARAVWAADLVPASAAAKSAVAESLREAERGAKMLRVAFSDKGRWTIVKNALGITLKRTQDGVVVYKMKNVTPCLWGQFTYVEPYVGAGRFAKGTADLRGYVTFAQCRGKKVAQR